MVDADLDVAPIANVFPRTPFAAPMGSDGPWLLGRRVLPSPLNLVRKLIDHSRTLQRPRVLGLGCAKALVEHGMPGAQPPPNSNPDELPRFVIIAGREEEFPEDIIALLLNE